VVYRCECNLHSDLVVEILEHIIVKLFCVVDYDVLWDTVMTDDVLTEEFLDACRAYVCNRLRLNLFCEVFHCYDDEGVVALSWI
jgi:hypothetical protein